MTGSPDRPPKAGAAEARTRWQQAAFRKGAPFILAPAILMPFPLVTAHRWLPSSLGPTVAFTIGWTVLAFGSIAYGWWRTRKYKRDHPFGAGPS